VVSFEVFRVETLLLFKFSHIWDLAVCNSTYVRFLTLDCILILNEIEILLVKQALFCLLLVLILYLGFLGLNRGDLALQ